MTAFSFPPQSFASCVDVLHAQVLVISAVYGHDVCRLSSVPSNAAGLSAAIGQQLPPYSTVCYTQEGSPCTPAGVCPCMLADECASASRITLYLQTNYSGDGRVHGTDMSLWQSALTSLVEGADRLCCPLAPPACELRPPITSIGHGFRRDSEALSSPWIDLSAT